MKQFNYLSHKDLAVVVGGRNNWQTMWEEQWDQL